MSNTTADPTLIATRYVENARIRTDYHLTTQPLAG
ncbi:hypothetical protein EV192_104516 [Actinocrispum wychmicini]|uniref:Uncharacterized protein n=1 Tax=Actinocrispum wychmicini TaxID=1213861 RepID=A0A4R2JIE0_9PSEU|nr:hypothetical protein EV192_104516 [Actinocrispum wychmicini]